MDELASATAPDPGGNTDLAVPLQDWLDQAQDRHAEQATPVLAGLLQRAPRLPADGLGAQAIRLAEHVGLGHCADLPAVQALVRALPPALALPQAEATFAAVQRLHWCVAMLQAEVPMAQRRDRPDLPPAERWRALQNVVLALAWQGRCDQAGALLAADEAAAQAEGPSAAGKAYAASANNVATHLQADRHRATPALDRLMLQAAHTARRAWAHAGDWMAVERAEYRLALCHAAVGDGTSAVRHALRCVADCEAAGAAADAVEHFFAHEALVQAQRCAGNGAAADAALQHMHRLLPQIGQAGGLQAWCASTLQGLLHTHGAPPAAA